MKIGVVALTKKGRALAEKVVTHLADCHLIPVREGVVATFARYWRQYDGFVCIMATGIVVRAIAPLLRDKRKDPCVVVMDEKCLHVISLLSGHIGGGNELTLEIAKKTGAVPVITTASDIHDLVALDLWAAEQQLAVPDPDMLTRASSRLVNSGKLLVYSEPEVSELPAGLELATTKQQADIIISNRREKKIDLQLCPKNLVVGIGCNRNAPLEEFEEALEELLEEKRLLSCGIRNIASIDVKNDEPGLLRFAEKNCWQIEFFSREQINTITGLDISTAAMRAVGAIGVAEPTALLSAQSTQLLCRKRKWQNITMAIAQAPFTLSARVQGQTGI